MELNISVIANEFEEIAKHRNGSEFFLSRYLTSQFKYVVRSVDNNKTVTL
jgi:hypothetical protein